MEDWELVRGRLQQMVEDDPRWADIRAALERVEDQAKALDDTLTEYENAMRELGTLRQRVEELERESKLQQQAGLVHMKRNRSAGQLHHRRRSVSNALDVPYTTSCGHTWTMRHTACPECFAALRQRVEDQAKALDDTLTEYENAMRELGTLRQRVEELERDRNAMEANWGGTRSEMQEWRDTARSEMAGRRAAVAEVERLREEVGNPDNWQQAALKWMDEAKAAEAEVERLRAECARHKRNAECYACEAGDPDMDGVQDTKLSRAEAEVERLTKERDEWRDLAKAEGADEEHERKLVSEMARLQAALREWREAESSPDCVACCTLDAALAPEVKG